MSVRYAPVWLADSYATHRTHDFENDTSLAQLEAELGRYGLEGGASADHQHLCRHTKQRMSEPTNERMPMRVGERELELVPTGGSKSVKSANDSSVSWPMWATCQWR